MAIRGHILGVDFGTSNSSAGFFYDGRPRLIEMAPGKFTLPTTFFFDFETRQTLIGEPANQALLDGYDGRFMRTLKRVLGTPLMHEKRQILNERVTFVEIIGDFLRQIKIRAEAETNLIFDTAISGRPVVFHSVNDPREQQAEVDLRACYLAAGFKEVEFMAEPEAAAIASGALKQSSEISLIVDIGGGTSDFSLFQANHERMIILANHGARIGGTDFDRTISFSQVMPLLGKGTQLRNILGPGTSVVPNAIFNDLATWEKIPFLYTPQNSRLAHEMSRLAIEPDKLRRLANVLDNQLGHDLAFAVEHGKIVANAGHKQSFILLDQIERGLTVPLPIEALARILAPHTNVLRSAVLETLQMANLHPEQVGRVIYVGGSSLMTVVVETMKILFPSAQHSFSDVFTAVTDGLAIASTRIAQ